MDILNYLTAFRIDKLRAQPFFAKSSPFLAGVRPAVNREVHLQPTPDERPDELLRLLTAYAERRGLTIDEPDEPLAYVDPISRDHYLEMWPGWLR